MSQIELSNIFSEAVPNDEHGFLMSTKFVALGYGVGESTIRNHKKDRPAELLEGQHWIKNEQNHTQWTARGVIQLGFCTQSKQGEEFRRWAEQQIMGSVSETDAPQTLPASPSLPALDATAEAIADVVVGQLSAEQMLQERVNFHVQQKLDNQVQTIDPDTLGKGLAAQWGISNLAAMTEAIATLTTQPKTEVNAE